MRESEAERDRSLDLSVRDSSWLFSKEDFFPSMQGSLRDSYPYFHGDSQKSETLTRASLLLRPPCYFYRC